MVYENVSQPMNRDPQHGTLNLLKAQLDALVRCFFLVVYKTGVFV